MGPLDAINHLLNFFLPVLCVGGLTVAGVKLLWRRELRDVSWRRLLAGAWGAGAVAWVASLWLTGHDGQMLGYVLLGLANALGVWFAGVRPR